MTPFWVALLIKLGVTTVLLIAISLLLFIVSWAERKQSALIQDRIGANRAKLFGVRAWGLWHNLADTLKLILKEDYVPPTGDKLLHTLAPFLAMFCAMASFAVIPYGPPVTLFGHTFDLQVAPLNVGLLYIFAMMSIGIYGFVLAGYASNNNYAFLGGLRAASQMISYEVTMGATIVGLLLCYNTLDLQQMVIRQGDLLWGWLPAWGLVLQPVGFFLFMAAGTAETKRIPFDLPEGESEIIGYYVEYSGMKYGMFFSADLLESILVACLAATLFLGGWQLPYLTAGGFLLPGGLTWALPHWLVVALQVGAFAFKVVLVSWVMMTVRWTLPRFRYDQLMKLGWTFLLPISLANILLTGAVIVALGA